MIGDPRLFDMALRYLQKRKDDDDERSFEHGIPWSHFEDLSRGEFGIQPNLVGTPASTVAAATPPRLRGLRLKGSAQKLHLGNLRGASASNLRGTLNTPEMSAAQASTVVARTVLSESDIVIKLAGMPTGQRLLALGRFVCATCTRICCLEPREAVHETKLHAILAEDYVPGKNALRCTLSTDSSHHTSPPQTGEM